MSLLKAAAAALGCAISVAGCARQSAQPTSTPTSTPPAIVLPDYKLVAHGAGGKAITISDMQRGKLVYEIKAASVIYRTNLSRGTLSGNTLVFYKGGAPRLTVSAPTADLSLKTYDVTLRGGVSARNNEGATFRADEIAYVGKQRQLEATGHVVAASPTGTVISGDRGIADLDLHEIRIFGNVGLEGSRR